MKKAVTLILVATLLASIVCLAVVVADSHVVIPAAVDVGIVLLGLIGIAGAATLMYKAWQ